jgi:EmrB/QacA subfamily drug resistance transporter
VTRGGPHRPLLSGPILGLASGAILVPLNSTMLAVALPSLMREFEVDAATIATLVTLYLAAVVVALPASGALGDRFGHRRTFLIGITGFAVSSLLAVMAPAFMVLAAARVLQAASGALVSTSAISLVRASAPPDRRGAMFGLFDMLVSSSAALGPFIGGILVSAFGWRALFLLALPVAAIAGTTIGLLRARRAAEPSADSPRPVDVPGLAMLGLLLSALLIALQGLDSTGGVVAAALLPVLLVAFVVRELRVESPAVDLRLFAQPAFAAAVLGVLGMTVVLHATFILVPLSVEALLRGTPTTSGIVLLGISGVGAIAAPFGGRLSDRFGRRAPAVSGALLMAAALGALAGLSAGAAVPVMAGLLGVVGLGFGLSGSPRQAAALEVVAPNAVGMAAGTYFTGRYLGGVLGAMLAGTVLAGGVDSASVGLGFVVLAAVAVAVAVVSVGLPGARPRG